MNWTKTPPTKPGDYKVRNAFGRPWLYTLFPGGKVEPANKDMEFCGPLLPSEEVTAAFYEGVTAGRDNQFRDVDTIYKAYSRARRVVEGEIV